MPRYECSCKDPKTGIKFERTFSSKRKAESFKKHMHKGGLKVKICKRIERGARLGKLGHF